MRWKHILILVLAATMGALYYQRTHVLTTLAQSPSASSSTGLFKNSGGIGKVGGIGPTPTNRLRQ